MVEARAGEVLSLVARVENRSSEIVDAKVMVSMPGGWSLLLTTNRIHLRPGDSSGVILPIIVPQYPSAGEYEIGVGFIIGTTVISDAFKVRIPSVRDLQLELESAPASTLPGNYETTFLLANRGNRVESVLLSAKSNRSLILRPDPGQVELAPGESIPVRVVVPAIIGLSKPSRHIVTLQASSADGGVTVSALARTEIIAIAQPERLAFHTYPIELRLDFSVQGAGDETSTFSANRIEAAGRGTLSEDGDTVLGFKVSYRSNAAVPHLFMDLSNPEYRMVLGEQRQELGTLLRDAKGFGLTLRSSNGLFPVSVYGLSTTSGPRAGFTVGALGSGESEYIFRGSFGTGMATASAKGKFTEQVSEEGRVILEVEPALDFLTGARAFQSSIELIETGYEFSASIVHQGAEFVGNRDSKTEFSVSGAFDLLSDLELNGKFEVDSRGAYRARRSSIGIEGSGGEFRWSLRYRFDSRRWSNSGSDNGTFAAGATFQPNDGWGLGTHFSWSRLRSLPSNFNWETLYIQAVGFRPMFNGSFLFGLGVGYEVTAQQVSYTAINTGWQGNLSAATSGEVQLNLNVTGASSARLRSSLTHELANGTEIEAQVDLQGNSHGRTDFAASLNLVVPLDIRLSRKEGVSSIVGRIRDAQGKGISGLVVRLAGFSVLTEADGSFSFPAIPAGEHVLFVPGLAPSQVAVPNLPLVITAPSSGTTELRVFTAATVRGEVEILAPAAGTTAEGATEEIFGGRNVSAGGMRIKMVNGTGQRTTLTTSEGRFEFSRLPPGNWSLSIDENSVPPGYQVEPATIDIRTRNGQVTELSFTVRPVQRKIRFMNGGDLGCSGRAAQPEKCRFHSTSTLESHLQNE